MSSITFQGHPLASVSSKPNQEHPKTETTRLAIPTLTLPTTTSTLTFVASSPPLKRPTPMPLSTPIPTLTPEKLGQHQVRKFKTLPVSKTIFHRDPRTGLIPVLDPLQLGKNFKVMFSY